MSKDEVQVKMIKPKKTVKFSKFYIIIFVFLIVLGSISTLFYVNLKKHQTMTIEATVKKVGNNYIVVEDENNEEYSLETDQNYNVGDMVSFVIKDIEKDSYPKKGTVLKIDTIRKSISFIIEDVVDEETNTTDNNTTEITNDSSNDNSTIVDNSSINETIASTEEDIIAYFENLNNNLDTYNQDKSIGDSLKSGFVNVVDFLFYDGEIKGKTFDELSSTAKLKVLSLALSIDQKIDKHFPNYKEEISTTSKNIYNNVKSKATVIYLDITTSVCENDPYTCKFAKEGLSDMKDSFSLTWSYIKEISGVGISKLKDWYEVWKEA